MGKVLADSFAAAQDVVHVDPYGGRARDVSQRTPDHAMQGEHGSDDVCACRRRSAFRLRAQGLIPCRVARGCEVLEVGLNERRIRKALPGRRCSHRTRRPRFDRGARENRAAIRRSPRTERVDAGTPVVDVGMNAGRGHSPQLIVQQRLMRIGRRTGPQEILRLPHRLEVLKLTRVVDFEAHRLASLPYTDSNTWSSGGAAARKKCRSTASAPARIPCWRASSAASNPLSTISWISMNSRSARSRPSNRSGRLGIVPAPSRTNSDSLARSANSTLRGNSRESSKNSRTSCGSICARCARRYASKAETDFRTAIQ